MAKIIATRIEYPEVPGDCFVVSVAVKLGDDAFTVKAGYPYEYPSQLEVFNIAKNGELLSARRALELFPDLQNRGIGAKA